MESIPTQEMGKLRRWGIHLCQWLWGKRSFFWITFLFGLALNIFAGWLYTPWSTDLKKLPIGWVFQNPLIVLLLGICLLLLTSIVRLVSHLDKTPASPFPQLQLDMRNRDWLLTRVHAFWITGVLEQSLHEITLIELQLSEQQDAIQNPWRLVLQEIDQTTQMLLVGTSIPQIYDRTDGELLILGEPGSGKTTLLLQLARDLLERARQDDTCPIPVIFNLSSWAIDQQPFPDWLIEELHIRYQVPSWLGQLLVHGNHILPLLDGLDEVISSSRTSCIKAINTYRQEHGIVPTIVCSRSAEYFALEERLLLRTAVIIQPLTKQQIDEYLASAGTTLDSVREALREDPALQELVTTPLMLNVLALAYHGSAVEEILATGYSGSRRQHVFAAYVQRVLRRREVETRYTAKRTEHCLSWLAWQMIQHNQTEFHIEQMELNWQSTSLSLWLNIIVALLVGLTILAFYSLLLHKIDTGVEVGFFCGLLTFLTFSGRDVVEKKLKSANDMALRPVRKKYRNSGKFLTNKLTSSLSIGLLVGLPISRLSGSQIGLIMGLAAGLYCSGALYLQRAILRLLLWHNRSIPWNYPRFLDYANERILLRKVGKGYIFIHRLLLEYFATLYPAKLHPNPTDAYTYWNRGNAYGNLKQYERALQDFDRALQLDPKLAGAYHNRGLANLYLKNTKQAESDYKRCYELDSTDIDAAWMATRIDIGKQRVSIDTTEHLKLIAAIEPDHYIAHICRGIASGLRGNLKQGLSEVEKAIALEPKEWDAYFWKGMLCAYYYQGQTQIKEIRAAVEQALEAGLPPILLTPLYWLEKDRPDLFILYAKCKLEEYQVL